MLRVINIFIMVLLLVSCVNTEVSDGFYSCNGRITYENMKNHYVESKLDVDMFSETMTFWTKLTQDNDVGIEVRQTLRNQWLNTIKSVLPEKYEQEKLLIEEIFLNLNYCNLLDIGFLEYIDHNYNYKYSYNVIVGIMNNQGRIFASIFLIYDSDKQKEDRIRFVSIGRSIH